MFKSFKEYLSVGLTEKAASIVLETVKSRKEKGLSATKTGVVSEAIIAYYGNARINEFSHPQTQEKRV